MLVLSTTADQFPQGTMCVWINALDKSVPMSVLLTLILFSVFFSLKNFGAEALGDIRVDLLPHMTPPRDPIGMSPQDPPTVMNISNSGNSKYFSLQYFKK